MYHLIGQIDPNENQAVEPFPQPTAGATITFWQGRPMTLYCACLVKVDLASTTATHLSFYGVNVSSELPDTSVLHTVDLRDTNKVWPSLPTSKWQDLTATNCYLVLLLLNKWVDDEPTLLAAKAEDGGKWPRGSADKMRKLESDMARILERLRKIRGGLNEKGREDFDSLFAEYLR